MKIYTRFGDRGSTSLIGGAVVQKNDPRVKAYGSVDELNAVLGVAISFSDMEDLTAMLSRVQEDLFVVGAELATKGAKAKPIPHTRIEDLEKEIDAMTERLPPLHNFILPGGSKTASLLHLARTICRRAERDIVALSQKEAINPDIVMYMNRVGDLLFTVARSVNYKKKTPEVIWKGR
ncbi:MAG: cob(I)yrinic acid a,c-diamide adenosyltransferase [Candidatus Micrarchaeota archaeon]